MTDQRAVLVVEDEAVALVDIVFHLQEVGFKVYEATNTDEAIRLLNLHDDIRVLLTNRDMPGSIDGIQLARAVRDRWPPVKIVVTCGRSLSELDIIPDGVMFIASPYPYEEMTRSITRLAASYRHGI